MPLDANRTGSDWIAPDCAGMDFYAVDQGLQDLLAIYLPGEVLDRLTPHYQRLGQLAIARALIGSPKLIVLDEPTSAVDGRTEKLIRRTLSELREKVTVVIISHRVETTAQCDILLVLADGKVADYGERDEVLAGSAYRSIVLSRHDFDGEHID